jgi:hypothetical protein
MDCFWIAAELVMLRWLHYSQELYHSEVTEQSSYWAECLQLWLIATMLNLEAQQRR